MQDWQSFINGRFVKKNIGFNLRDKLEEVELLMESKAEMRGIRLLFEANFEEKK